MRMLGVPRRKISAVRRGKTRQAGGRRHHRRITTSAATICPTTVAMAAPAMPSSGSPSSPKISSGSRAMLVSAPEFGPP